MIAENGLRGGKFVVAVSILLVSVAGIVWTARGVIAGHFQPADDAVLAWFQSHRSAYLDEAMLELTALGSDTVLVVVVLAAVGLLLCCRLYKQAAFTVFCPAVALVLTFTTKELVDRPRPEVPNILLPPDSASFPSGHAFVSMTVCLTLAWFVAPVLPGRAARAYIQTLAILLPIAIGVSRVYLGVHYPTDVLAGWLAGLAWATACRLWWLLLQQPRSAPA